MGDCLFVFIRRQPSSVRIPKGNPYGWHGSLHDLGSGAPFALFFSSPPQKRQIIYRKKSKIVKIYQYSKNIENKLKYFKKCVDKCTALYYIKLNKRETEQPNREGWERSTKESIEREV